MEYRERRGSTTRGVPRSDSSYTVRSTELLAIRALSQTAEVQADTLIMPCQTDNAHRPGKRGQQVSTLTDRWPTINHRYRTGRPGRSRNDRRNAEGNLTCSFAAWAGGASLRSAFFPFRNRRSFPVRDVPPELIDTIERCCFAGTRGLQLGLAMPKRRCPCSFTPRFSQQLFTLFCKHIISMRRRQAR